MRMTAEQRREQLLDATKAIVLEDGFHAVSIEAVARAAGITRPIVYGHFADLGGLLEALVERESRRALSQLPDTYDDLLGALTAYLNAVRTDPDTWRLVLVAQEGGPRPRPAGGPPAAAPRGDRGRPRRRHRPARPGAARGFEPARPRAFGSHA